VVELLVTFRKFAMLPICEAKICLPIKNKDMKTKLNTSWLAAIAPTCCWAFVVYVLL